MQDLRPIGYVLGLLAAILGATMLLPMIVDWQQGNGHGMIFFECAALTVLFGLLLTLSCANGVREGLTVQQTFLVTTLVWLALPAFGAIPFMVGATKLSFTDAFFEAMSGLTTTGSTVIRDIELLPPGLLLWRGLLQWLGGIGIIVVAMVFLPELRVGGMQIFRSEGFDTFGKILPRATQISRRILGIYVFLTGSCAFGYIATGMEPFDALVHAMTTTATGGFSNYDLSFAALPWLTEYVAVVFMLLAALPFVRFVQLINGNAKPLLRDSQIRAFLLTVGILVLLLALWRYAHTDGGGERVFRKTLFNTVSLLTGTGYASTDYMVWGAFPVTFLFFIGLIGGCAGSTSCSIKIFRYQLLFASILAQLRSIRRPHGVFKPRYAGRSVEQDVLNSVMSFFVFFIVLIGILSLGLSLTGLDFITSVSGAAAAMANIGPGLGPMIGPTGNYAGLGDAAKWMLSMAMLVGRLEIFAVLAILTIRFWRA